MAVYPFLLGPHAFYPTAVVNVQEVNSVAVSLAPERQCFLAHVPPPLLSR